MALYLRKSVRVGPFRFNLSGSGVGVSCGIPGFRIGTGPRGNYIHAGRGGIYYRAALPSVGAHATQIAPSAPAQELTEYDTDPTLGAFKQVDSGMSLQMQDVSSESLLNELNDKRSRPSLAPIVLFGGIIVCVCMAAYGYHPIAIGLMAAVFIAALGIAAIRDRLKKTTVLMYDLDAEATLDFANLTAAFEEAALSDKIWHVQAEAAVLDRKYHAGAARQVKTDDAKLRKLSPPKVKTNIQPLAIPMPRRTAYLFPDRLLVSDAAGFGAVDYPHLRVQIEGNQFIPGSTTAPRDATIVDYTWHYVNKGGGPDRRFSNNPRLPIIEVRDLSLSNASGFAVVLKFSNIAAAEELRNALVKFTTTRPSAMTRAETKRDVSVAPEPPAPKERNWLPTAIVSILLLAGAAILAAFFPSQTTASVEKTAFPSTNVAVESAPPQSTAPEPEIRRALPVNAPAATAARPTKQTTPSQTFVTLRAPVSISTPTGRTTLQKGTRLPFVRVSKDSVIVHYYDGRDYPIPLSATDKKTSETHQ